MLRYCLSICGTMDSVPSIESDDLQALQVKRMSVEMLWHDEGWRSTENHPHRFWKEGETYFDFISGTKQPHWKQALLLDRYSTDKIVP